ncbi:MAG: 2,3-diphosphoglycerate-dependent phosphoglycerate mutase [Acidimicrobiales bacterium]|nr:2,3-diphosphoglycerate-dependent phosphoglycerate mutase [Acidimicrobiales bacterium]
MAKLILIRHGQSEWNAQNRFTGWTDVDLSTQGEAEARSAGRSLVDAEIVPDIVHTSVLKRSIRTASIALEEMDLSYLPIFRSWRLNERHYGKLQGLNKKETADKYGADQVKLWRRSYDIPPEALEESDERHPIHDVKYKMLPKDALPATECLKDVVFRMIPFWQDEIAPALLDGKNVLVVAHGNSNRALLKHLENISDQEIVDIDIPTGVPRVYDFSKTLELQSVSYIGDPEAISKASQAVAKQAG